MNRTLRALLPALALGALASPVSVADAPAYYRGEPRTPRGFNRSSSRRWPAEKTPADFVALFAADAKRARKNAARLAHFARAAG